MSVSQWTKLGLISAFALMMLVCPTRGADSWRSIPLPGRPFAIASHNNVLWVCGLEELIASSTDMGKTWQTRHRENEGEVLTQIAFIADKVGYAAGSNGLVLWTHDDGETWVATRGDTQFPRLISFAGDQHGIRSTHAGFGMTADGGATWEPLTAMYSRDELRGFTYIADVATLDKDHSLILLKNGPYSDWYFFTTADAGKTWKLVGVPSTGIRSVVAGNGEYWAFGHEVIEKDKPGGGYGVAVALHSKDGEHWDHGVRSPKEYYECNSQGCLIWDGGIVDVFGDKPVFIIAPPESVLTPKWAAVGNVICTVGNNLKCADTKRSDQLPPPPPPPETQGVIYAAKPKFAPDLPGCILCSYDTQLLMASDSGVRGPVQVVVNFTISKNGIVKNVKVSNAPNALIERNIAEQAEDWVFAPTLYDGVHMEQCRAIRLNFQTSPFGGIISPGN